MCLDSSIASHMPAQAQHMNQQQERPVWQAAPVKLEWGCMPVPSTCVHIMLLASSSAGACGAVCLAHTVIRSLRWWFQLRRPFPCEPTIVGHFSARSLDHSGLGCCLGQAAHRPRP